MTKHLVQYLCLFARIGEDVLAETKPKKKGFPEMGIPFFDGEDVPAASYFPRG